MNTYYRTWQSVWTSYRHSFQERITINTTDCMVHTDREQKKSQTASSVGTICDPWQTSASVLFSFCIALRDWRDSNWPYFPGSLIPSSAPSAQRHFLLHPLPSLWRGAGRCGSWFPAGECLAGHQEMCDGNPLRLDQGKCRELNGLAPSSSS